MSKDMTFKLLRFARTGVGRLSLLLGGLIVAVAMIGILRPAASLLPYSRALAFARSLGFAVAATPGYGRRQLSRMRHAFGRQYPEDELRALTAERITRLLCDSVVLRRALCGRADSDHWRLEQRTTRAVDELRASKESFILATAHFSRQPFLRLYRPDVLPQKTMSLLLPPAALGLHPRTWWLSYHYGQMLECMRVLRPDLEVAYAGQLAAYRKVLARLKDDRSVVVIHVDAARGIGKADAYVRPFAGLEARTFATGAARLSRITRRPIAVCIPYIADERTIVLDWTRVIRPSDVSQQEADRTVTDTILDDIEQAIGRRPGQYLLECLGRRRWDASTERWVS